MRYLIPLPVVDAPPSDPSYIGNYPEYKSGSTVLALFPDTTSFYKAVVVQTPKEIQTSGSRVSWQNVIPENFIPNWACGVRATL
jgi:hypothetical protein